VEVNYSQRWSSEVARRGGFADDALSSMQEGEEEDDAFLLAYTRSGIGLVGWSLSRAGWATAAGLCPGKWVLSLFFLLYFFYFISCFLFCYS
jgi:hypothetical protein